ncbi:MULTISPECIES: hypothetical protein [unclassified Microcoleus]|uniref:hypothetical protein n=1 Tax=unclassified Microcoleus TaxID=2642155 RepID=UPI002FD09FB4
MNDSRPALKKIIANPILANNSRLSGARSRTAVVIAGRTLPDKWRISRFEI